MCVSAMQAVVAKDFLPPPIYPGAYGHGVVTSYLADQNQFIRDEAVLKQVRYGSSLSLSLSLARARSLSRAPSLALARSRSRSRSLASARALSVPPSRSLSLSPLGCLRPRCVLVSALRVRIACVGV
jgi:hypothetical protein